MTTKNEIEKIKDFDIDTIKRSFSWICTTLLNDKKLSKSKKKAILFNVFVEFQKVLIIKKAKDKDFHYINKCYVLTIKKLS